MDRRDFVAASTLVAAAAAAGGGLVAGSGEADAAVRVAPAGPALMQAPERWTLAVPRAVAYPDVLTAAHRIAHRLAAVLGEGRRIEVVETVEPGLEAVSSGQADLYLGLDALSAESHPGFEVTSGLPLGAELGPVEHLSWLTVGDGCELQAELAGLFDVVARPAFVTGPSPGLATDRLLERPDDLAGLRIACSGLARRVVVALGAQVGYLPPAAMGTVLEAIAGLDLDVAEPLLGTAAGLAHWSYAPGLTPGGLVLSLGVRASLWARFGRAGQAAFEGVAAEAVVRSQADAAVRAATLNGLAQWRRWPVATNLPAAVVDAIVEATRDTLATLAAGDPLTRRTIESHAAFRAGLGERLRASRPLV